VLAAADPYEHLDRKIVRARALKLGLQYAAQGHISTPESLSTELFDSGIALAANAGLLEDDATRDERLAFVDDVLDALKDLHAVQQMATPAPTVQQLPEMLR
jgi:glycerol-3-phosphate O-acyltransferase